MVTFWATFGKIKLLFILTSGHTGQSQSQSKTVYILDPRLQRYYSTDSRSVPTTPDYPSTTSLSTSTSPKKKNLSKFLGLGNDKQQQPLPETPGKPGSSLVKNSLSSSTPMVLESCDNNDDIYHSVSENHRWQSNDGLLTPGSIGALSPFTRSPVASPTRGEKPTAKMTADKGVMTTDLDETMAPYLNRYMFNPCSCPCQRPTGYYGTASATSSPFHTGPRGGANSRGRAASVGRPQMSPLQRGGLGTITRARGVPMVKKLPRSMTLDDLDPQQYIDGGHHGLHLHHQQHQQQRVHHCHQPQPQLPHQLNSPMYAPQSILRMSRRESLGYEPCHAMYQYSSAHSQTGKQWCSWDSSCL